MLKRIVYRRALAVSPAILLLTLASTPSAAADGASGPPFTEVAAAVGLDFVHFNGMSGEYYFPEMTGQGGALLDYDADGDLDLYLVQGSLLGPGKKPTDALFPYRGDGEPMDRLYRNELVPSGKLRFVDVTATSGLAATGYGMGVATGDYDGDGHVDVYVTNYGPNQLWRNRGDGTFEDVTTGAGADDPRWSTSATFFDYDRDGRLDLYVANYVDFSVAENPVCYADSSRRDYCGPSGFASLGDRLLHNRGDGTFEDVTASTGMGDARGAGLGVVSADFDGDGWLDLYVANDGQPNFLWLNQEGRRFEEAGLLAGVAVNARGLPEASMGITAGDADGDGDEDLFMTHLMGETNTLYLQEGGALFTDATLERGLAAGSLPFTAFGTRFFDYDNDGWLDLIAVNGAVRVLEPLAAAGDLYPLDQTNQLFHNRGGGRFEEVTTEAGEVFRLAEVSRGAAFGDVDEDGDTDVVVFNNNGPVRLLRNEVGAEKAWLGLRLVTGNPARDALGAVAEVVGSDRPRLVRRAATDGSYCSANDPRILFGLGSKSSAAGDPAPDVRVTWPDGRREVFRNLALRAYHTLRQGSGTAEPTPGPAPQAKDGETVAGSAP